MITKKLSDRNKNLTKNFSLNLIYKVAGLALSYITVPLVINYLNAEKYGIWETIMSILAWTNMMDIGIGNGLRNKFAISYSNNNSNECSEYASTAYICLSIIIIVMTCILSGVIPFLNWTNIFNTNILTQSYIVKLMLIVFVLYMLNFILSLINSLYYGVQKSSVPAKRVLYHNLMYLFFILILRNKTSGSLILLAVVYQISLLISYIILTIRFFNQYRNIKISIKYFKKEKVKDILNIGIKFLVLQITSIIIFTTDNMIITKVLGPIEVTTYSISKKIFGLLSTGYALILIPLWSAFTEAYSQKDILWIKNIIKKLNYSILVIAVVCIILILNFNFILKLWIGNAIEVPKLLIIMNAVYVIISSWNNIYAYFLNGIGALNLSLIVAVIGAIINIPISIFFASTLNMGVSGILLGTIISLIPSTILQPIQSYILINRKKIRNKILKYLLK